MGVRARVAVLLVVFGIVLAGCDDPVTSAGSSSGSQPGSQVASVAPTPGCSDAAGRTGARLPAFAKTTARTKIDQVASNPCFDAIGLVGEVTNWVPAGETGKLAGFVDVVRRVSGRLTAITDTAKCSYEADRLAIGIYRHPAHPYSVGVVAVVRGTYGAVIDAAFCYFTGVSPQFAPPPTPTAKNVPVIAPCTGWTAGTRKDDGQFYTILWAGSTDWICGELDAKLQG